MTIVFPLKCASLVALHYSKFQLVALLHFTVFVYGITNIETQKRYLSTFRVDTFLEIYNT